MKIQKATRVLVVDDFKSFREWILSRLKTHAQFEIVGEASTGQDAIQMAERLNPDLILLDLGLPDINGIEAGKQISRILPLAKILFLSGCAEGDTVEPALCLGTSGYLFKGDAERRTGTGDRSGYSGATTSRTLHEKPGRGAPSPRSNWPCQPDSVARAVIFTCD